MSVTKINMKVEFDIKGFNKGISQIESSLKRLKSTMNKTLSGTNSGRSIKDAEANLRQQIKNAERAARERLRNERSNAREQLRISQRLAEEQIRQYQRAASEQARAARSSSSSISNSFSGASSRVSSIMNSMKTVVIAGFAAIGASAVGAGLLIAGDNGAIKYAMKTESAIANLKTIFGEHAEEMTKWLQSNAAKFGAAEAEMLQYGSSYGLVVKRMTSDVGEAAELTKELVAQTSIVAAATGFSKDVVFEKTISGLRGETEAIEDLGVNITVANLKRSKAFEQLAKGQKWEDLSGPIQQQIILLNILEQFYQNYGNTLSSTVGKEHSNLVASLKDIKNGLGQAFLPIYATILPSLMTLTEYIKKLVVTFGQFTYALFGNSKGMQAITKAQKENKKALADSYGKQLANAKASLASSEATSSMSESNKDAVKSSKKLNSNVESVGKSAKKTAKEIDKATAGVQGFDTINKMQSTDSKSFDSDIADKIKESQVKQPEIPEVKQPEIKEPEIPTFKDGGYDVKGMYDEQNKEFESMLEQMQKPSKKVLEAAEKAREFGKKLKEVYLIFKEKWIWFKDKLKDLFTVDKETGNVKIVDVIKNLLPGLAGLTAGLAVFFAIDKFMKVAEAVKKGLGLIRLAFVGISWPVIGIAAIVALLAGAFVSLWNESDSFRNNVIQIWENLKTSLSDAWENFIKPILSELGLIFTQIWEEHIKPLWDNFKAFIESFVELCLVVQEKSKPLTDFLTAVFMPIFKAVFIAIGHVVKYAFAILTNGVGLVLKVLKGLMDYLIKVFTGDWKGAWDSIKDIFSTVTKGLVNGAIDMGNAIIGVLNGILTGITDLVKNIFELLGEVDFKIPDIVPGIGGKSITLNLGKFNFDAPQIPPIPKLAQGGLIKPRKPRTVIVGDNMYEDEIVSPESKMVDSFRQANMEMFGNGMSNAQTNNLLERIAQLLEGEQKLSFDEAGAARMVRRSMNTIDRRNGRLI